VLQEPALAVEPSAVAGEAPVGADHPVARDRERHGVSRVAERDRTDGGRASGALRELGVGDGPSPAHLAERVPDSELELGPFRIDGNPFERVPIP